MALDYLVDNSIVVVDIAAVAAAVDLDLREIREFKNFWKISHKKIITHRL